MGILLYRIDDRLIHGQVVVGWGQPFDLRFIVLVDDGIAESDWEQELYRMAVPPDVEVSFHTVEQLSSVLPSYQKDSRTGILLVSSVETMSAVIAATSGITKVNLGGVHHRGDRTQYLRYMFLSTSEEEVLKSLQDRGIEITAQDVPAARPVPLDELLSSARDY